MKNLILRSRLLFAVLSLIRNPTQTDKIFFISDHSRALPSPLLKPTLGHITAQPGFRNLFENQYDPAMLSLTQLLTYPKGTLGHELGVHIETNHLALDFFPPTEGSDELTYVARRVRRTHDIWHVLTGFDTSPAGEVALQAFTFAQLKAPLSALLIAVSILHTLSRNPSLFFDIMEKIFLGHRRGVQCSPLIGVPLEQRFGERLDQLRQEFGLISRQADQCLTST